MSRQPLFGAAVFVLEEMLGSAKELKRRNGDCKGILAGPLMAPRFACAAATDGLKRAVGYEPIIFGRDP